MRNLVRTFIKYPFYANIIIFVLILGGGIAILSMKKSFFPETTSRNITVSVFYPGASPKEMEEGVTMRIENSIRGLVGIKQVTSTSSENFASVVIETTGEYDLDETLAEVKNAVDGISSFPVNAERPVVFKQRNRTMAMFMALSGDVDLLTLKNLASDIEDDLMASGFISQLTITGFPNIEISVEITEETLLRYGLTFAEIERAIYLNNQDISAGQIKSENEEILIRSRARSIDPNDIAEIILRANTDGTHIRVRDVATVKLQFEDVPGQSFMNGKQSVSFQINKLPEEDLESISDFVNQYVEDFNNKHESVQLEVTYDFLAMLGQRLKLLYNNGGIGLALVLISLGLFLSFRLSLWVAWGIPASFLAMFMVAALYGITINMISLFGMILVIGILVDDGIVIAENIYSHFEKGKSSKQAALDGTMEVLPAVTTSVTTTIIAFSPLFFAEGRMEFMFEMAFVVVFSLLFSLMEAFFVLPAHLGSKHILRANTRADYGARIRRNLESAIRWMRFRFYARILKWSISYRYIVIFIPVALIIITVGMFNGSVIKATFFPSIPFDQFNIDVAFKPGDGEKQTFEYLERFEDAIWEVNDDLMEQYNDTVPLVNHTFLSVGGAFNGQETGTHAGNIFVLLRDLQDTEISSYEIVSRVGKKIGPIPEAEKFSTSGRHTFGTPVSVSLLGKDLEELDLAKAEIMQGMKDIRELNNIIDNNAAGKREVRLKLKPKAYFLGLNHADISNQVRQGFFGGQAQRLQVGKDEVRVWVRYPKQDRINVGQLENMKIKTARGEFPLSELVYYEIERGPVAIKHFNSSREVRIDADLHDPMEPVPPIIERIEEKILPGILAKYPGIRYQFLGQQQDSDETMQNISTYYSIAFLIILLILMVHFRSVTQMLIIIMMIPLAWLGSVWGHGLEGHPVSMLSAWGMVAVAGVIINDAVVFLSKYNSLLLEGLKVKDAAYNAGLARFRAIVLTTITTSVGLYPLILENSFQAQFLIPMAISLAYGVAVGTSFLLLFFPALIVILNDLRRGVRRLWTGQRCEREDVEKAIIFSKREFE